jgi:putative cell wall-binding protein
VPGGTRSATVASLRNGHHYDVRVAARNHAGTGPATTTTVLPLAGGVQRVRGDDRVATAAAVSARSFDPGVSVAYIATAASFPDALAGGPAAVRDGGPILLTARDALSAPTRAELERLAPGRIVVLGGAAAVADEVIAELGGLTVGSVRRLQGADRYATSAAIARTFGAADTVYLTTGQNFPDALAGAALAARTGSPVLLTAADRLPDPVAAELERLSPARIVILGGTKAVSQTVAGQATLLSDTVERIEGPDRYATAAAIADRFPAPTNVVYVATGANFPDALAGAPAAALTGSPVVLVAPSDVPASAATALQRLSPREIGVLGGLAAVSAETATVLAGYLR